MKKVLPIQSPSELKDLKWQNDQGKVNIRFEFLSQEGYLTSDYVQTRLGSGVYIMKAF